MATWELAGTARSDFADMVEALSDDQLGRQTLCGEWDAVSYTHLTLPTIYSV